jgi:hypothetical protein
MSFGRNVTVTESYSLVVAENTRGRYVFGATHTTPPRSRSRPDNRDRGFHDEGASMDLIGAAPLALGVLIALGSILVTMSYLSE